jgi:tRNA threonylcarbamoyl adenosine modification protein YeaZ
MKILALELSSARGSIAIGEGEFVEEEWPNDRKNSGIFFRTLETLKRKHGPADVVVAGLGPGSYAGIRIAVATAIGLATAWRARLVGAPSICAMEGRDPDFFAVGDARRNGFFFAEVRNRQMARDPEILSEEELRARLAESVDMPVFSAEALSQFSDVQQRFPSAAELARLVSVESPGLMLPPLQPLYLREPSITLPKNTPFGRR